MFLGIFLCIFWEYFTRINNTEHLPHSPGTCRHQHFPEASFQKKNQVWQGRYYHSHPPMRGSPCPSTGDCWTDTVGAMAMAMAWNAAGRTVGTAVGSGAAGTAGTGCNGVQKT